MSKPGRSGELCLGKSSLLNGSLGKSSLSNGSAGLGDAIDNVENARSTAAAK